MLVAADMPRKKRETPVITDLATRKMISHSIRVARKRHINRGAEAPLENTPYFYFFFAGVLVLLGALGFLNVVWTVPPSI